MPDIPNDRNDILEFIKEVNKDRIDLERPILVHSASGSGRSSLYISLNVIIEQIKENGVFNLGFILESLAMFPKNLQQYIFLVETAKQLVKSNNEDRLEAEFLSLNLSSDNDSSNESSYFLYI